MDWKKVLDYFMPRTQAALQEFFSAHQNTALKLNNLKASRPTIDFSHYEKILQNKNNILKAKEAIKSYKYKEFPEKVLLEKLDKSFQDSSRSADELANNAKSSLSSFTKILEDIKASRPVADLHVDDVRSMFKEKADRVLLMRSKGISSFSQFRKKYGMTNITD